jgi:acetylornithine deacetylase/succinyl-diaminopimelate desuccinylase family protein
MSAAELVRDLVRLPSVNPMGRAANPEICYEHRVTAYLEEFFKGLGVSYERQPVAPGRDNIIAFFSTTKRAKTLLLEAHQDTVPIDNMTVEPFGGKIDGGRIYGRGACDIKGGMAAMLTAFARLAREQPTGAMNVIMACTVDEEHTFLGVQELAKRGPKADFAVVAEPTSLDIVHAHKGIVRWFLSTTGRSCHSSKPEQGVNAIYRMGKVLAGIEGYAQKLSATPADPLLGNPTISVGIIAGGSSVNTVPDRCTIEIDRRLVGGEGPLEQPAKLNDFLRQSAGIDFPLELTPCWIAEPPLVPENADDIIARLGAAIDAVRGSHAVRSVPFGTDAATISFSGTPAVIFGPGDIAQAHTVDEWLPIDELDQAVEILYRLAVKNG